MADYTTLFTLILTALTFVIIGIIFIVYIIMIGEREKKKLQTNESSSVAEEETTQDCPHFFGYLSGYPLNEPIPDECFGCTKAIECVNEKTTENTTEVEETPQQQ